jgi:hypothetical protein
VEWAGAWRDVVFWHVKVAAVGYVLFIVSSGCEMEKRERV